MATYTVLDLSKYNTVTNYTNIGNSVDGVIIRAGYRGYGSSGTLTTDTQFENNYNGLKGKTKIGVYWLSQAITEAEATAEANYLYNLIKNKTIDFPVYLDSEWSNSSHNGRADSLSKAVRTNLTVVFCERMKALGYRAGVYASDSWFSSNLDWTVLSNNGYSLWVAKYSTTPPKIVTKYDGWQHTDAGSVSGVSGKVDLSYFYNDVAGWNSTPTPTPTKVDINTLNWYFPQGTVFDYIGSEIQCPFGLLLGSSPLTPYTDFTWSFANNVNAGKATCYVTGVGNYTGNRYFNFYINPLDIENFVLTFDYDPTYDGNPHYAYGLKLYDNKLNRYLTYGTEYSVGGYEGDVTNVGWVSFYVKGLYNENGANYTGSKWGSYRISPANLDSSAFSLAQSEYKYTGSAVTPPVIHSKYTEGTDYSVSYTNNVNIGTATCTITGTGNYQGTVNLTFKISSMDIADKEIVLSQYTYTYNIAISKYEPTVTIAGLTEGTDFTVSYANNTAPGTATAIATGIGNFTGSKSANFTIVKKNITDYDIKLSAYSFPYTGQEIRPTVTVGDGLLVEGTDYELIYYNNIDAGTATVVANGINSYTGQLSESYQITYTDIITCAGVYGYESAVTPYRVDNGVFEIYSDDSFTVKLKENTDYIIASISTVDKIKYYIKTYVVKGINGYHNETQFSFNVITEDEEERIYSESVSESISMSESQSESISASESESASISESISVSNSISESESISEYQSESASISESESISNSISESESISQYQSESASISESISISVSESISEYKSQSESASESESISASISMSEYQSMSTSASISESESLSESASIAYSESVSTSISMSIALSESESTEKFKSESISASVSASEAASISASASESASIAYSESVSNSISISNSISESLSNSVSESISESESASISESEYYSTSTAESESYSISESESYSISVSESISEYQSQSYSESVSASISNSQSVSTSISESLSVSVSESISESEWHSESQEFEDVEIWTYEGDFDLGEYVYNHETEHIDLVVDPDSVAHEDYDYNIASGDSSGGDEPVPEEGYPAGTKFTLDNTPTYATYSINVTSGNRSGDYYIYSSAVMNNRIRMCRILDNVEEPAKSMCWCDVTDLFYLDKIGKGDRVKVHGKVYPDINDRTRYINIQDEIMYIRVSKINENTDIPYGVSFEERSAIIGYTNEESLTKLKD